MSGKNATGEQTLAEALGVEFDPAQFSVARLISQASREPLEGVCDLLAQVVVKCPDAWGKPNSSTTYKQLPLMSEFRQLIEALEQAHGPLPARYKAALW